MLIHCLGVGSIGTLFATSLASIAQNPPTVRLILRKKDLLHRLVTESSTTGAASNFGASTSSYRGPLVSLRLEREGLSKRSDGFEIEVTPSPADRQNRLNNSASENDFVRNDMIKTLLITTKAPATLPSLQPLLPRLSAQSTIILCQNGMGVLESLLDRYWPEQQGTESYQQTTAGGRPNFICATTTHGVWRKGPNHFVHAGKGDVKFGLVPNKLVLNEIAQAGQNSDNPILNPTCLVQPYLDHLPDTANTNNLKETLAALLKTELNAKWLPLPTLQMIQLQKLAVNTSVNALTAILGVRVGALLTSNSAKQLIRDVCAECSQVFAAHLANEQGFGSSQANSSSTVAPLPEQHLLSTESLTDNTLKVVYANSVNLTSTLQDLLSTEIGGIAKPGSPTRTEIDFINGYVVALGRKYNIDTPITRTTGELTKIKEDMIRSGAIQQVAQSRTAREKSRTPGKTAAKFARAEKFEKLREGWNERDARLRRERRRSV